VLGAEADGLPAEVVQATRVFFERNLDWLAQALTVSCRKEASSAKTQAAHILASLEGAMILAKTLGDEKAFEAVAQSLMDTIGK
jgi:TetR/AcrR family transcriptional repressor of nem operon